MLLSKLLSGADIFCDCYEDCDITSVTSDSRKVSSGSVFVCIKGRTFDGHDMAASAVSKGAAAVVTDHRLGLKNEIVVDNGRFAYARLCQSFFGNPQRALHVIAVTGTNGKTTVTNTIKNALSSLGHKAGLIGTIRCEIGDMIIPAKFTTPEAWDISALFAQMVAAGCDYVVTEASSQALAQGRLMAQRFDCAVFTNLTLDHLDYHGDMESYYQAKKLLFLNAKRAVINYDDDYGRRLAKELDIPIRFVSTKDKTADYSAENIDFSVASVKFDFNGAEEYTHRINYPMPGLYSVYNAMCAAAALIECGFDANDACRAVSSAPGARGRCEVLYNGDFTVLCDFAHTADGLEQLLSSIRPFAKGRLVTLFGCAGDRDPSKRRSMADAVSRYSDFVVLSSDNPRTEDPDSIIRSVGGYLKENGTEFVAISDRYNAIVWALKNAKKGDVLALCGKGHEDYQVLNGYTVYLDEHQIVKDYFADGKQEAAR